MFYNVCMYRIVHDCKYNNYLCLMFCHTYNIRVKTKFFPYITYVCLYFHIFPCVFLIETRTPRDTLNTLKGFVLFILEKCWFFFFCSFFKRTLFIFRFYIFVPGPVSSHDYLGQLRSMTGTRDETMKEMREGRL